MNQTAQTDKVHASPPVAYRPRRLGHVNLFVENLEETSAFLHDVCGLERTGIITKSRSAFYSNGNTHHDIGFIETNAYVEFRKKFPDPGDPPGRGSVPGLNHFGWEMENEQSLVDGYRRASENGLRPRITNNGTSLSNYLFDPDGLQHQFYADEELDWRKVYTGGDVDLHRPANWVPGAKTPSTDRNYDPSPKLRRDPNALIHPMRVTHGTLLTRNFGGMFAYYTDVAGLEPAFGGASDGYAYLRGSASHYDVVLVDAGQSPVGLHHASFEVWPDEDLDAAEGRLSEAGVRTLFRGDFPHKRSLCIAGPSGFRFEFFVRGMPDFSAVRAASPSQRPFIV